MTTHGLKMDHIVNVNWLCHYSQEVLTNISVHIRVVIRQIVLYVINTFVICVKGDLTQILVYVVDFLPYFKKIEIVTTTTTTIIMDAIIFTCLTGLGVIYNNHHEDLDVRYYYLIAVFCIICECFLLQ